VTGATLALLSAALIGGDSIDDANALRAGGTERIVLIDFGFASLEGMAGVTQQGMVVGSLSYLAPERLRGEAASERSDLYALAVVLYELLVGKPPFVGSDVSVINGHLEQEAPPPSSLIPTAGLPAALDELLARSLAKDPARRASSAKAMAAEIEAVARGWS